MKQITKEQIAETLLVTSIDVIKTIDQRLVDNIEKIENGMNEIGTEDMKKHSLAFAVMNTTLQMSIEIMIDALCELLCEE